MLSLVGWLGFFIILCVCLWFALPVGFTYSVFCVYCVAAVFFLPWWFSITLTSIFVITGLLIFVTPIRTALLSNRLLRYVKKSIPPMSETEKVALNAGDVWVEGGLFKGEPDWTSILSLRKPSLSEEETAFLNNECETLCAMINDWEQMDKYQDLSPEVWRYIKEQGFFGLIIPKKYGGKEFSALAHSTIVQKIASRSISTAVSVMVPNSLGPAELLLHYGTEAQKEAHLPKLAKGEEIPCFALTSPEAGSDAGAITDSGVIFKDGNQLKIRLNWHKRYITLAPIATLIGVAFKLYDPENLLQTFKKELGITLALIPASHPGVKTGERHLPLGLAFMNGTTIGEDVEIPFDWVIGGEQSFGQGWRMLMECLSVGRSISLPALAVATAKLCYRMTGAYASIRKQFKLPIAKFEGVEEAMARIGGYTYMMDAVRVMTADAVGLGVKPSLVSAITKYHLTEMGRKVLDDAMDVHAGRGIQFGPRNYLGIPYISAPMSITVEGANILTRNLMIFGQGAMRCHPYIREEIEEASSVTLGKESSQKFDSLLKKHIYYGIRNFVRTIGSSLTGGLLLSAPVKGFSATYYKQLTRFSMALAYVADLTMGFLGGELKRKERLSARLGDVLSHLYIGTAVLKYYQDFGDENEDKAYVDWALKITLYHIQQAFKEVFDNFPSRFVGRILKWMVFPLGLRYKKPSDKIDAMVAKKMTIDSPFRDRVTSDCYFGTSDDASGRVEHAFILGQKVKELEKKVKAAQAKSQLPKYAPLQDVLDIALEKQILTDVEVSQLREYEKARLDALAVDVFHFKNAVLEKIEGIA